MTSTTASVASAAEASTPSSRIAVLDVARGVAILGTLATNIWIFTDPAGMIGMLSRDPLAFGGDVSSTVEAVFRALANGKFLGMLTLMFGIGLAIQQQSAQCRGLRWPGRYPWRAALLLGDGVLHYVLVVEFDVLMGYAVTGMIVAFVLATTPRAQRAWMWVQGVLHVAMLTLLTAGAAMGGSGARDLGTVALYTEGTWWQQVVARLENVGAFRAEPIIILPMSIVLFLLGAQLYRAGLFDERGRRIRRVLVMIGAGALPLDLAIASVGSQASFFMTRYGIAPFIALGLLGATAMLVERRGKPGFIQRRLAGIGRMALSCYVLQNIVCSVVCYGWGLGLAPELTAVRPWGTIALFVAVGVLEAAVAFLWLRRFSRGPIEALWAWAYALPLRRTRADATVG